MFGDLFGNIEQQQEELQKKLATIEVAGDAGDGAIKVIANANQKILNISIDQSKLDWEDKYFALINSVNFRKWIFSIDFL